METYRVILHNPAGNPDEEEERYVFADDAHGAELQALDIIAGHPFNDVTLRSVTRLDPEDLYHDESPD